MTLLPWMLPAAGALLAIGSMIVSESLLKKLSQQIDDAQNEVDDADRAILSLQSLETSARADLALAETLLGIFQTSVPQGLPVNADFHQITRHVVQGLGNRFSAATGSPPSKDDLTRWQHSTTRAVKGDLVYRSIKTFTECR